MGSERLDLLLVIAPIAGFAGYMATHLALCRFRRGGAHLGPLLISFTAGFAVQLAATVYISAAYGTALSTEVSYVLLNSVSFSALAYCYFTVVNLTATSLRVRIIRRLRRASPRALSTAEILSDYNAAAITEGRIARFKHWGQILERDGRLFICGTPAFLRLANFVATARKFVFGSAVRKTSSG